MMRLIILRSLWTNGFDVDAALADCGAGRFDGLEGPIPEKGGERADFAAKVEDANVPFVAEIGTGGGYVPTARTAQAHLDDFARKLEGAAELRPLFATVLFGCDSWSLDVGVIAFGRALEMAAAAGILVCFETHRSRFTYSPWRTAELLAEFPSLRLTCDFSHWCCVCERLVLDDEPELLRLFASRAQHIHARVGYEQGPQVSHPAAAEHRKALESHESWWREIWESQRDAGHQYTTLTPEFGPDGYLQARPFTQEPAASLDEINFWIATRQRHRFSHLSMSIAA